MEEETGAKWAVCGRNRRAAGREWRKAAVTSSPTREEGALEVDVYRAVPLGLGHGIRGALNPYTRCIHQHMQGAWARRQEGGRGGWAGLLRATSPVHHTEATEIMRGCNCGHRDHVWCVCVVCACVRVCVCALLLSGFLL